MYFDPDLSIIVTYIYIRCILTDGLEIISKISSHNFTT